MSAVKAERTGGSELQADGDRLRHFFAGEPLQAKRPVGERSHAKAVVSTSITTSDQVFRMLPAHRNVVAPWAACSAETLASS